WTVSLGSALPRETFVSFDVNYRSRLWGRPEAREVLQAGVGRADLVIASDDELDLVADGSEEDAAGALLAAGASYVVVKRGALGASLWTETGRVDAPAVPVTAVDTVGA